MAVYLAAITLFAAAGAGDDGGFSLERAINWTAQLTRGTPLAGLLAAYALFGLGLGMVNPAIANSAVAGMPLA